MNKCKKNIRKLVPFLDITEKIIKLHNKAKFWTSHSEYISLYYTHKIYKKYNCCIAPNCEIKENILFPHPIGIVIGEGVKIGKNCTIYQNVTLGRKNKNVYAYPTIGDNVIIYSNATILGNIKVGNNATIGCNSVVLRDVNEGETVCGIVK